MPRTRSVAWSELKLGVVGVVALLLVTVVIVAIGGQGGFPWQRYSVKARFQTVDGLKTGAVVRLSGKDVGQVSAVEFSGSDIEVTLQLSRDVRPLVTTASTATIGSLSLLGDPIVDVTAAPAGTPLEDWGYLATGAAGGLLGDVSTKAAAGMEEATRLLADVRAGRGTLGKLVTDDALYRELEQFVAAAGEVTRNLNAGRGTLGGLLKDPAAYASLKVSLANLETLTARMNSTDSPLGRLLNDEAMGRSLSATAANAETMTGRLARGEGTLGKLLTDDRVYDQLNTLTRRIDEVTAGLTTGRGTAGQLLQDRQLYENMNRAVNEMQALLADIRKDPKKYLRVSVSIF